MKKKTVGGFIATLLIASYIPFLEGCIPCDRFFGINDASSIEFTIKDKNRFIFDVYPIDSFRVFFNGQRFDGFSANKTYGSVNLTGIYNEATDQAVFTSQVCKDFVFRYTFKELDTLKVCFNAKPDGNCGNEFHVVSVVYNGQNLGDAFPRSLNR